MDPSDLESLGKKRRHDDDFAGTGDDEDDGSDNEHQTSKSRGTVTVQIFIKSKQIVWLPVHHLLRDSFMVANFFLNLQICRDVHNDQ